MTRRLIDPAVRAVPVVATVVVAVLGPGTLVTAACGLAILAYLLVVEGAAHRCRPTRHDIKTATETLGTAAIATLIVTALFWLPPPASWLIVPPGIAAATAAYVIARGQSSGS